MITGLILLASVARATCIDTMETHIRRDCAEPASVTEIRGGDTQFYTCESDTEVGVSVFVFTFDPDLTIIMSSEPESCSGGSLYISDDKSLDTILKDMGIFIGLISDSISAAP